MVQSGLAAFHNLATTTRALAAVHPVPGNTGPDAADMARLAAAPVVSALVDMKFVEAPSRTSLSPRRKRGMASTAARRQSVCPVA